MGPKYNSTAAAVAKVRSAFDRWPAILSVSFILKCLRIYLASAAVAAAAVAADDELEYE